MKFLVAVIVSVAIVLVGCELNELRPVPIPVGGGNSAPARPVEPVKPAQTSQPMATSTDFQGYDYVWASSYSEAFKKCQDVAEFYRRQGKRLKVKPPTNVAGNRWKCSFEEEKS
jgi:hypothetical protein